VKTDLSVSHSDAEMPVHDTAIGVDTKANAKHIVARVVKTAEKVAIVEVAVALRRLVYW
jgi:hypothetical protein